MLLKLVHTLLGFLLAMFLARVLGPDGYGVYAFALAFVLVLAIPAQVGLPQVVIRETAKAQASKEWGVLRGLWRWSNRYVFLFSVLIISFGLVTLLLGRGWLTEARWSTLMIGLTLVPLLALGNIRGAALRGLGRVLLGQIPERVLRPGLTLFFLVAFFWGLQGLVMSPALVMALHAIAAFFAYLFGVAALYQYKPTNLLSRSLNSVFYGSYWRKAAMPLALVSGLQMINNHADVIMLGFLREDAEVGVYRVTVQVATLVVFALQSANLVLQPHFARLYSQGELEQLQKLVTYSARLILFMAILLVIPIAFSGELILSVFFGEEYGVGALTLSVLAIGQLFNAAMGSVGVLLNMTGHERETLRGVGIAAICNIFLNALLIPFYGMEGAAVATSITLLTWNVVLRRYVWRDLKIESSALGVKR